MLPLTGAQAAGSHPTRGRRALGLQVSAGWALSSNLLGQRRPWGEEMPGRGRRPDAKWRVAAGCEVLTEMEEAFLIFPNPTKLSASL